MPSPGAGFQVLPPPCGPWHMSPRRATPKGAGRYWSSACVSRIKMFEQQLPPAHKFLFAEPACRHAPATPPSNSTAVSFRLRKASDHAETKLFARQKHILIPRESEVTKTVNFTPLHFACEQKRNPSTSNDTAMPRALGPKRPTKKIIRIPKSEWMGMLPFVLEVANMEKRFRPPSRFL